MLMKAAMQWMCFVYDARLFLCSSDKIPETVWTVAEFIIIRQCWPQLKLQTSTNILINVFGWCEWPPWGAGGYSSARPRPPASLTPHGSSQLSHRAAINYYTLSETAERVKNVSADRGSSLERLIRLYVRLLVLRVRVLTYLDISSVALTTTTRRDEKHSSA